MALLMNYVCDSANAPGTSVTINLAGPPTGRLGYSAFTTGATVYYFIDDGTQAEWGYGVFTSGSPNTLTRATVIGNTAGTLVKLNFAGAVNVYNEIPAEKSIYADTAGLTTFPGAVSIPSGTTGSFGAVAGSAGYRRHPGGITEQWGNSTGPTATVTFPVAFSSTPWNVVGTPANVAAGGATGGVQVTGTISASSVNMVTVSSAGVGVTMQFYWKAVGPT